MPNENEVVLAQLREEKKRVRADVYDLGKRFNAGETGVRAALDAAIRRSDELEAEIARLTPQPPPFHGVEALEVMYGPPPVPNAQEELAQLRAEKERVDAARRRRDELQARLEPPYPSPVMYGPPAMPDRKHARAAGEPPRPPAKRRGFLDWLFGRK